MLQCEELLHAGAQFRLPSVFDLQSFCSHGLNSTCTCTVDQKIPFPLRPPNLSIKYANMSSLFTDKRFCSHSTEDIASGIAAPTIQPLDECGTARFACKAAQPTVLTDVHGIVSDACSIHIRPLSMDFCSSRLVTLAVHSVKSNVGMEGQGQRTGEDDRHPVASFHTSVTSRAGDSAAI